MAFRRILEDSAPFLRVPLSIFDIFIFFLEAVLKLSVNLLSPEISARADQVLLPPDYLGGIHNCLRVADIHPLIFRWFLLYLIPLLSLLSWGVSKILRRTALL